MSRYAMAQEPAVARPTVRPSVQIVQRRCSACGERGAAKGQCPSCASADRDGNPLPPSIGEVLSSSGEPLDEATRRFMERRLGHDFTGVRVHSGSKAAEAARSVNAAAFTVGNNIVLSAGVRNDPQSRKILAHELVHVVQQSGAAQPRLSELGVSSPLDPAEAEADRISQDLTGGLEVRPRERMSVRLSRQMEGPAAAPTFQTTPTQAPATPGLTLGTCSCCVSSMAISNINRIDNATHMGHSFDLSIGLDYAASGPDGNCVLEWWEKTNIPYHPSMPANTWTDMYALIPNSPTLAPWHHRTKSCGTSSSIPITDPPAIGKNPGRTVTRTLEFRLVVKSMPQNSTSGCANADQQVTAKQVLAMVNATPDWSKSSFTTP